MITKQDFRNNLNISHWQKVCLRL